jgi:hypothetical protein
MLWAIPIGDGFKRPKSIGGADYGEVGGGSRGGGIKEAALFGANLAGVRHVNQNHHTPLKAFDAANRVEIHLGWIGNRELVWGCRDPIPFSIKLRVSVLHELSNAARVKERVSLGLLTHRYDRDAPWLDPLAQELAQHLFKRCPLRHTTWDWPVLHSMGAHATLAAETLHPVGTKPFGESKDWLRIPMILSHDDPLHVAQRR